MKNIIVKIGTKLFIPSSILMIAYCIFHPYLADLEYLFIVKLLLLASFVFQFIGWVFSMQNNKKNKNYPEKRNIIENLYLKLGQIITQIFCYYFALYLVLMLDEKSILYNYLLLLLFGLLLGYRIAIKVYKYQNEKTML